MQVLRVAGHGIKQLYSVLSAAWWGVVQHEHTSLHWDGFRGDGDALCCCWGWAIACVSWAVFAESHVRRLRMLVYQEFMTCNLDCKLSARLIG